MTIKTMQTLEAENAALRNSMQQANTAIAAGDSIIADLRAQLAAAQKDAERYRWLNKTVWASHDGFHTNYLKLPTNWMHGSTAQHFEAAIDAAIAKENAQ